MDTPPALRAFARRPFTALEIGTQKELAIVLNIPTMTGNDWRDVAGKCGFSTPQIKYISSIQGCQTMNFFNELGSKKPMITIGEMFKILLDCERRDAVQILSSKFEEVRLRAEAESAQPLDLSTPRRMAFPFETPPSSPHKSQSPPYAHTNSGHQGCNPSRPNGANAFIQHPSVPVKQEPPPHNIQEPHLPSSRYPNQNGHLPMHNIDPRLIGPSHALHNGHIGAGYHHNNPLLNPELMARHGYPAIDPALGIPFGDMTSQSNVRTVETHNFYPQRHTMQHMLDPARFATMAGDARHFGQFPGPVMRMNGHVTGMHVEGPPPLMPIEDLDPIRTRSPPPPYDRLPPPNIAMTQWRESHNTPSPNSVLDSNSSGSFDNNVILRGRGGPVEHPNSIIASMETDAEDITQVKRPLEKSNTKLNSEYSNSKMSKKSSNQEDKLAKQHTHAFVMNKLRDTLRCSSESKLKPNHGPGSMDYSDDDVTERKVAVNQVPTVVEATYDNNEETNGSEDGDDSFNFLHKAQTFPRSYREHPNKDKDSFDLSILRETLSSTPKLESAPFKQSKGNVFMTYDSGSGSHELHTILKDVNHLRRNVKHHKFDVHLDSHGSVQSEEVKKSIFKKFEEADFVLVCISPTYNSRVKRTEPAQHGDKQTNNARLIYKMMQKEFKRNSYTNNRFIPVLICGARLEHAPEWFAKICPKETFYTYPQQLRNLLYHLTRPDKVMARFMEKQKLVLSLQDQALKQAIPSRNVHSMPTM